MNLTDAIGYAAAGLVLLTFSMQSMKMLRVIAIASNVAFIGYGALGDLLPIVALHAVLLPVNVLRLVELRREAVPEDAEYLGVFGRAAGIETE